MEQTIEERPVDVVIDMAEVHDGQPLVRYSATEASLAKLREIYKGATFDLRTTAGNDAAREARKNLVTLRTSLESRRKQFKAPALAFGRLIDTEAERITTEILALEEPIDQQIKADEKRRAEEKAAREKAEAERVAKLRAGVDGLRAFIVQVQSPGMTAARLQSGISVLTGMAFPLEQWQEFHGAVTAAHAEALDYLRNAHAGAVEREAEAARLAADRAEFERQKAAMRAEQELLEADRKAAAFARAEAERAAAAQQAVIEAAARQREAAEHARMERERLAEMTKDAPKPEDDDPMDPPPAVPATQETVVENRLQPQAGMLSPVDAAVVKPVAEVVVATDDAAGSDVIQRQDEPPTLKGGDISARLGFTLQAAFIAETLGVPWRATDKAEKLWRESDFGLICAALVRHVEAVRAESQS